jgi:hypothetical protein
MSLIKNISKYSHCILGMYELRPPLKQEEARGNVAGMDATQYYEASATGGAVPFKFLIELRMAQHGEKLFDAYYSSLKHVISTVFGLAEKYAKDNNITFSASDLDRLPKIAHRLGLRIRVFIPRVFTDKVDTEILWYIKGNDKGTGDFNTVAKECGLLMPVLLARELSVPIRVATDAIKSNM